MDKIYYTVYKVSNKINGKFYIGTHKTKKLDDGYMGSGKYLKAAQKRHGLENFEKEILFVFETPEEMFLKEAELVNEEFLETQNTYNLKVGGFGGFDLVNSLGLNLYSAHAERSRMNLSLANKRLNELMLTDPTFAARMQDIRNGARHAAKRSNPNGTFFKKKHSNETKAKIGELNSLHQRGSGNSQYGSFWITNGVLSSKCREESQIPPGWRRGRHINRE